MTTENQNQNSAQRYMPAAGALAAIEPKALDILLLPAPPRAPYLTPDGKACVIEISGPLCYAHPFFDTYEQIRMRVSSALALAKDAGAIILKLNTPGGDVAGAFDTARWMRAAVEGAGKELIAFTEAQCCSAGYALASAAGRIVCSSTGVLGSIGVITCIENKAAQNAALGLRHYVLSSGEHKGDGNPNVPMSEDALASIQSSVDAMAQVFFGLVRDHRGAKLAKPQALEGRTLIGEAAVAAGLADECASWDSLCAGVAAGSAGAIPAMSATSALKASSMADEDKDKDKAKADSALRASLAKAAEGDDKEEAARAKRALAAFDEDEKKASASDDEEEKKAKAKAEEDEKAKAAAAAATTAQAGALAAQLAQANAAIAALQAESDARKAADAAQARASLFATRPDLTQAALKALEAVPTAQLQSVLDAIPRALGMPTLARPATAGDAQASGDRSDPATARALDATFGLTEVDYAIEHQGVVQSFGVRKVKA